MRLSSSTPNIIFIQSGRAKTIHLRLLLFYARVDTSFDAYIRSSESPLAAYARSLRAPQYLTHLLGWLFARALPPGISHSKHQSTKVEPVDLGHLSGRYCTQHSDTAPGRLVRRSDCRQMSAVIMAAVGSSQPAKHADDILNKRPPAGDAYNYKWPRRFTTK